VHFHHFEDAETAAITRVMAVGATPPAHEACTGNPVRRQASRLELGGIGTVRFLALRTHNPDQPLSHDGDQAGCHQKWLYANVYETCNGTRRVVRMQCTEN